MKFNNTVNQRATNMDIIHEAINEESKSSYYDSEEAGGHDEYDEEDEEEEDYEDNSS
jgi:hypothetical protein